MVNLTHRLNSPTRKPYSVTENHRHVNGGYVSQISNQFLLFVIDSCNMARTTKFWAKSDKKKKKKAEIYSLINYDSISHNHTSH